MFQEGPLYVASATSTCVCLAYEYSDDACIAVVDHEGQPQVDWLNPDSGTTVLAQRGNLFDPAWRRKAVEEVVAWMYHADSDDYDEALSQLVKVTVAWAYRSNGT